MDLTQVLSILEAAGIDLTGREIAEALWLAQFLPQLPVSNFSNETQDINNTSEFVDNNFIEEPETAPSEVPQRESGTDVYSNKTNTQDNTSTSNIVPAAKVRIYSGRALPNARAIARALRPLMRRIPSKIDYELDEKATAQQIAEKYLLNLRVWAPILKPAPTRWLEVALVVDNSTSMAVWQTVAEELYSLLVRQGAFRDVRMWRLDTESEMAPQLFYGNSDIESAPRSYQELFDASGRRLIIVLSDCVSKAWQNRRMFSWLAKLAPRANVTILQVWPQRLWKRTILGYINTLVSAREPGLPNTRLIVEQRSAFGLSSKFLNKVSNEPKRVPIPIVALEPHAISNWARMVAGVGHVWAPAIQVEIDSSLQNNQDLANQDIDNNIESDPHYLVEHFQATALPLTQKLAGLLASVPLQLPIMRLIQNSLLPSSEILHLSEFLTSGLIYRVETSIDNPSFEFIEGVRDLLRRTVSISETVKALQEVGEYINEHFGEGEGFAALIPNVNGIESLVLQEQTIPFAQLQVEVLESLGGIHRFTAQQLRGKIAYYEETTNPQEKLSDDNLYSEALASGNLYSEALEAARQIPNTYSSTNNESNESLPNPKSNNESKLINGLIPVSGCDNSSRRGDIIFIHGLDGHPWNTWHWQNRNDENYQRDNFWLKWLGEDLKEVGIWTFGYTSSSGMSFFDQANDLLNNLESFDIGRRPIIFVAHSTGGILVKTMLKTAHDFSRAETIIESTRGIVFLSTPNSGYTDEQRVFARLLANIKVQELKNNAPYLSQINEWYRQRASQLGITTKVYYATRPTNGILVVNAINADPGIDGVKPIAVNGDHNNIAQPQSKNNLVYLDVKEFIQDCLTLKNTYPQFDVFLAYNSLDKVKVRFIHEKLKRRGLNPWLDEEQIRPGQAFIDEIQQAIPFVKSAAIFIGLQESGKWQDLEFQAFIFQFVSRRIPLIIVLLPGVRSLPQHLEFLKLFRSVSFAEGIDDENALRLLEWAITGRKPKRIMRFISELRTSLINDKQVYELCPNEEFNFIGFKETPVEVSLVGFAQADGLTEKQIVDLHEKFFNITQIVSYDFGLEPGARMPNSLLCFVFEDECPSYLVDFIKKQTKISHRERSAVLVSWIIDIKHKQIYTHNNPVSSFPPVVIMEGSVFPGVDYLRSFLYDYHSES